MAGELNVDTGGLRSAAAGSAQTAADVLAGGADGAPVTARPSGAGISAVDAAAAGVRTRQAGRITRQAGDVSAAGANYDRTDGGGAESITAVQV